MQKKLSVVMTRELFFKTCLTPKIPFARFDPVKMIELKPALFYRRRTGCPAFQGRASI
jgi:hypothetical protein